MTTATQEANKLIKELISNAAVESFGLSHQVLFLEFRDNFHGDSILSIETDIKSNQKFDEKLNLTEDEKILLLFNRINLCNVVDVQCDDEANLTVAFDNGVQLHFSGRPLDKSSEPWQLASHDSVDMGGRMVIATYAGGYAIWDGSTST